MKRLNQEAKALLDRCEFHYTPKHGSWLNMAEIEFSALHRQCLDRRIADQQTLRDEIAAWQSAERNDGQSQLAFHHGGCADTLKRLYPSI